VRRTDRIITIDRGRLVEDGTHDELIKTGGRTPYGELVEAERKMHELSADMVKAQHRTKLQRLVAPEDGTIQQLAVHTIGGVVTPGQTLLAVVPISADTACCTARS
jgi:ABC-type multidrug transport system ATPase subunit